jgi:hypothetical protein
MERRLLQFPAAVAGEDDESVAPNGTLLSHRGNGKNTEDLGVIALRSQKIVRSSHAYPPTAGNERLRRNRGPNDR